MTGWTDFRPYTEDTWSYLRARFKCPFLLMSATMDESSLNRIAENLDLPRDKIVVLYASSDRPNIYQQIRILKKPIDIMYVYIIEVPSLESLILGICDIT